MTPEELRAHTAGYVRLVRVIPGPGVTDAWRLLVPDHGLAVSVTIMPYFSQGQHAYRLELYDRDSDHYRQWSSFEGSAATIADGRDTLARYLAEHRGPPT